jgi:hypothetical protein
MSATADFAKQCHTSNLYFASVSRHKTLQKSLQATNIFKSTLQSLNTPTHTMHFLSTTLIKVSLILFAASHIAIAGPVPDVGNDISVGDRERISGGSVSNSNQDEAGDFLGSLSGTRL